jgi:hypothetical protein
LDELPLASLLPYTGSAEDGAPSSLFVGFSGTMSLSDFPGLFIPIVLLSDSWAD